jgi:hypothetical protein
MAILNQKIANYQIDPSYYAKLSQAESSNNPNAKNKGKKQTATGLFQFIDETWIGMVKKYDLGYTLEDRKDPAKAKKVTELFTIENESYLKKSVGITPNNTDLYAAHWLGAGGATQFLKLKKANPSASISTIMSKETMALNKSYTTNTDGSYKTVGEVYNTLTNRLNETPSKGSIQMMPQQNKIERVVPYGGISYLKGIATNTGVDVPTYEEPKETNIAKEVVVKEQAEENLMTEYFNNKNDAEQNASIQNAPPQTAPTEDVTIENHYDFANQLVSGNAQQGGVIKDNMGQWKHPGEITQISSPNITMKGVNYPVIGIADTGEKKIMMPNLDYYFNGAKTVTEYPITR